MIVKSVGPGDRSIPSQSTTTHIHHKCVAGDFRIVHFFANNLVTFVIILVFQLNLNSRTIYQLLLLQ